jgi:hypothetical protein
MNYKIIIGLIGFSILLIIGLLFIVGTLFKWKPLIDPNERQWLFFDQYVGRKYFGISWVIIHNIIIGLGLILASVSGLLIALHYIN